MVGVFAVLLQLGLGVAAGLAAADRTASGDPQPALAALALQICSPTGIQQPADIAGDREDDGGSPTLPYCPGCLLAQATALPPQTFTVDRPAMRVGGIGPVPAGTARIRPSDWITGLNPRAPPFVG